jgi:ligand-binding sensor domain-containing protein
VYAIAQDSTGRLWFGTQGGVCSYDGKQFTDLAERVGRPFVNVRTLVTLPSGALWFGGQEGLFCHDGNELKAFTQANGLLADFVGSMIVDRNGHLWMGHPGGARHSQPGGVTRYDGKTFTHITAEEALGGSTVYCVHEDKAGNIWLGSIDAGACRYDGKAFTRFAAPIAPGK